MKDGFLILVGLTMASALCQEPDPGFKWHSDFSNSDMIKAAQIIVIGEVKSLDRVGPVFNAPDDHGDPREWQLVKTEATNETVLKGDMNGSSLEFFYYMTLGPVMGNWNSLHIGDRCVFFLNRQDGILRAVRDYWRSNIEIGSGQQPVPPATTDLEIQGRIATLLLTPGSNLNPRYFASQIAIDSSIAYQFIGGCRTMVLLKKLREYPSPEVRSAVDGQLNFRSAIGCSEESQQ